MIFEIAKLVTAGLCFAGAGVAYMALPEKRFKRVLNRVIRARKIVQEERKPDGKKVAVYPSVRYIYQEEYGFSAVIRLPSGITFSDFAKHKEAFEQMTNSEIQMEPEGKYVHMKFFQFGLDRVMNFHAGLLDELPDLAFPLGFSRRGVENHIFDDELGAHILVSGAPGTGKSILLRLIATVLLIRHGERVKLSLVNNKLVDIFPFFHIPNVDIVESLYQAEGLMREALETVQERKKVLVKHGCTKLSEYNAIANEPLPHHIILFDEYARFSGDKDFEKLVIEVGELGRFAGVHLVIATQRADGREVISPRIKDLCLTKVCFKMGTKGGSEIILGSSAAWELPMIPGRAIVFNNSSRTIQVPYMNREQCETLLQPLKVARKEGQDVFNNERQRDIGEFRPLRADES